MNGSRISSSMKSRIFPEDLPHIRDLLQQVAEGDAMAFQELHHYYCRQLQPLARRYLNTGIEAEEILQRVFMRIWIIREKLPAIHHFGGWLFTVTSHEYLMALRKKLTYEQKLSGMEKDDAPDIVQLPGESAELSAMQSLVANTVQQMPSQRRMIYQLSRDHGLKTDEIAERLSISSSTVKNTLSAALRRIREVLEGEGYGYFF